jgi:uncharacterized protein with NRDE domain
MCLVFLAFRVNDDDPVMLGANREESRRRPTTPPVCTRSGSMRCLLAGADRGPDGQFPEIGTWLGVNEAGLVVAVTNRRDGELAWEDQVRSRGLLAVALLGSDDPERAARFAEADLARGGYGGCNYLIADRQAAYIVQAPGARDITVKGLSSGVYAMTNLELNDGKDPRIRLVHEHLEPVRFVVSAGRVCRDERIVIDDVDRGTVSSSLILVGSEIRFFHKKDDPRNCEYLASRPFVP